MDPSPAADGSPDSLGVAFHLDVHSVWDTGEGYASFLACSPPRFTVRVLSLDLLISLCFWKLFKREEMIACLLFI